MVMMVTMWISNMQHDHDGQQQRIAIVGGGLQGLSKAFHLLETTQTRNSSNSCCRITIGDND
jgi:NADH dehydrogenase FAD-containing subunit